MLKKADKSTQFLLNLKDYKADLVLVNDVGIDWGMLDTENQWYERTKLAGWSHNTYRFAYNKLDSPKEFPSQWGGGADGWH